MSVERFRRIVGHSGAGPVDLGLAPKGTLRPIIGDFRDASKSILLSVFWSHDRTIKEWISLIEEYRYGYGGDTWPSFLKRPDNPIFYRMAQATEIEKLFLKNQRMRWICRKFIARVRRRIMDKRIVGETDLYTMSPIPESLCVRVYDITTRSVYLFHKKTMVKLIVRALEYSTYGIAAAQAPKNPYTNIKWNIWQLINITSQIMRTNSLICQQLPSILSMFLEAKFSLKHFFERNLKHLQIEAAVHFFEDLDDADAKIVFLETYDDLSSYMGGHIYPLRIRRIKKLLSETKDKELLKKWADLITAFWIFYNHKFMWKWLDLGELTCYYHRLQRETATNYLKPPVEVNMVIIVDGDTDS
jgi:hypothetical protein